MNVDDHKNVAQRYEIRSIPTLLVFKGGNVVNQLVGALPRAKIEEAVKKVAPEITAVEAVNMPSFA